MNHAISMRLASLTRQVVPVLLAAGVVAGACANPGAAGSRPVPPSTAGFSSAGTHYVLSGPVGGSPLSSSTPRQVDLRTWIPRLNGWSRKGIEYCDMT